MAGYAGVGFGTETPGKCFENIFVLFPPWVYNASATVKNSDTSGAFLYNGGYEATKKGMAQMSHYHHLSIQERENLLVLHNQGISVREISRHTNRNVSTISRELNRNTSQPAQGYSAVQAQQRYEKRREHSRRPLLLTNEALYEKARDWIVEQSWPPEEIAGRLRSEGGTLQISYPTIYRAINRRCFDEANLNPNAQGFKRNLRHKGKPQKDRSKPETRGKTSMIYSIEERPTAADKRSEIGHWEADTVAGTKMSGCVLTMVDRYSRYLLGQKLPSGKSDVVKQAMIDIFQTIDANNVKSITPDRGKECADHRKVSATLSGVKFYFAHPHSPWEKPSVENTNGLLREYMPKRTSFETFSPAFVQDKIKRINLRPRKCLGWKTPFEVFFNQVLHLT